MPVFIDDDALTWTAGAAPYGVVTFANGMPVAVVDDLLDSLLWETAPLQADNITITAVYNAALSKVTLTGGGLDPFTTVRFERSLNGFTWTTVRGGVAVPVVNGTATLDDYEFGADVLNYYRLVTLAPFGQISDTVTIAPILDRIWIKSLTRPFLNRPVTICGWSDVERPDRGADYTVVNRSASVAVTDLGGSQRLDLMVYAGSHADTQTFKYILASGDVLLVHTPANCEVPGGYFRVAGSSERRPHERAASRVFTLPLVESVPPGPDVAGSTNTWAAVLAQYATWADLLAANPTWQDLLNRIAPPTEVIVS